MTRRKKVIEASEHSESTIDMHHTMDEFADLIVDNMREDYRVELEPFEIYAQKLRSQIHTNSTEFRKRFSKGYQVLLEEIVHPTTGSHSS